MKKINIILLCLLGVFMVVSCEDMTERDPIYNNPTEFVLNTPALSSGCYDLENTAGIELSWSQPDYGFAAAVDYNLQISLDGTFTDESTFLSTTYNLCKVDLSSEELAAALCEMLEVNTVEDLPEGDIPVWVRVKSVVTEFAESAYYSNSIKLEKVKLYYAVTAATLPTSVYMVGQFCDWEWDASASMVVVNDNLDYFWTVRYLTAGDGFKFNVEKSWDGNQYGYDDVTVVTSAAGEVSADDDGNIVVETSGWYIIAIQNIVNGASVEHNLSIYAPDVYVYGPANGGNWESLDEWKFEVIDDPDAEYPFVSPTVLATDGTDDSCLRLCVCPDWGFDWWRSEFIFFDGVIEYRADGDDQERVGSAAGQVKLNFATGAAIVE
ncbi:MAG: SusF/SusE family outer membrane protein [Bacteroidales bacterium]